MPEPPLPHVQVDASVLPIPYTGARSSVMCDPGSCLGLALAVFPISFIPPGGNYDAPLQAKQIVG